MSRDYKNINKHANKVEKKSSAVFGNALSFLTGLSIGLLIAAYFYFESSLEKHLSGLGQDTVALEDGTAAATPGATDDRATIPKFEFYDILKNRKLNISERIASEQEDADAQANESNIYLLQVGSFKEYQAADQLRAQLALIGIPAYITRVVINGDDSRHRVRVGPFEDPQKLNQTRNRLEENSLPYMLLKLELEENQANG